MTGRDPAVDTWIAAAKDVQARCLVVGDTTSADDGPEPREATDQDADRACDAYEKWLGL